MCAHCGLPVQSVAKENHLLIQERWVQSLVGRSLEGKMWKPAPLSLTSGKSHGQRICELQSIALQELNTTQRQTTTKNYTILHTCSIIIMGSACWGWPLTSQSWRFISIHKIAYSNIDYNHSRYLLNHPPLSVVLCVCYPTF